LGRTLDATERDTVTIVKLLHEGLAVVSRALGIAQRRRGPRRLTLVVAADADEALLASAAALRRLGARITRYDLAAGALEARRIATDATATISIRAVPETGHGTRLAVESDAADSPAVFRRFRSALTTGKPAR
jgi:hypothetical protein